MRQPKNWYIESRQAIKRTFGDDWRLFCAIAAATSPNNSVRLNTRLAIKAYNQIKATGTVKRSSFINAHYKSLLNVIANGEPNGRKCQALYHALIGHDDYVPVDIWILRYFRIPKKVPTKRQYDLIESAIREDAASKGLTPAQRQAELWCEIRRKSDNYADHLCQLRLL